jgi:hypothetical protein
MTISIAGSFAYVIVIQDEQDVLPELRAMCKAWLSLCLQRTVIKR